MKFKNEDKTLVILDLDETLIFASMTELNRKADAMVFSYHIYKRPHLEEFLEAVKDDFLLAVWSSASDDYVEEVVKQIIPAHTSLEFVWGRSRCTYKRNITINEYGYYDDTPSNHYHYTKPLKKIKRKKYTLERVLIVDDTPHKSQNNFGNAIYPKEFKGETNDNELQQLAKYLYLLKDIPNVRRLEKRNWRSRVDM